MIRAALLVIVGLLPIAAQAEAVEVRSADHAGFSRLVVVLPEDVEWVFGVYEGSYELRTLGEDVSFDTSGVFRRMAKSRVLSVATPSQGLLRVSISEGVYADVFELRDRRVVVDIKDGKAPKNSEFETVLADPLLQPSIALPNDTNNLTEEASAKPKLNVLDESFTGPSIELPSLKEFGREGVATGAGVSLGAEEIPIPLSGDSDDVEVKNVLKDLEKNLIEQIGRAAAEGLLIPATPEKDSAVEYADVVEAPAPDVERNDAVATDSLENDDNHISIETAVQKAIEAGRGQRRSFSDDGTNCMKASRIDVGSWGEPLADGIEIASLRSEIVDELDAFSDDGLIALAKYYLFLTFGSEARALLDLVESKHKEAPLLYVLAEIVEEGETTKLGPLEDQFSCDTPAALWNVLGTSELKKGDNRNTSAIIASYAALPEHLRRELGPNLARKFSNIGEVQTASHIESIYLRKSPLETTETKLLQVSLAEAKNQPELSEKILKDVAVNNAAENPKALIEYVRLQDTSGHFVDPKIADMAAAVAVEYRGHDLEASLTEISILARVLSGQHDIAIEQLDLALSAKRISPEVALGLRMRVISAVIEGPSDVEFLKAVFANSNLISHVALGGNLYEIANKRLFELGFMGPNNPLASASELGEFLLDGMEGEDAEIALAKGSWADLSESKDPIHQALSTAASTTTGDEIQSAVPSLSDLSDMLNQIGKNKDAIRSVLSD